MASSTSAWGPFVKYGDKPVFNMWGKNTQWCYETSSPGRVDEIKATQVGADGGKFLVVKAVCDNGTALPVLWSPVDQSSWGPPYEITPKAIARSPLFLAGPTCRRLGFEEPTLFTSPADGFLHFIGHDHGACSCRKYAHYISRTHSLKADAWQLAAPFGCSNGAFEEPNPVPALGDGVFGGKIRSDVWVDFGPRVANAGLRFSHVTWRNSTR